MPTRRTLTPARVALLILGVLLTSACQLRLEVAVEVNRNGGGTLAVTVGADSELLDAAARAGADPLENLMETGRGLRGEEWRVTQRTLDDGSAVTFSREFADPEDFNELSEQLATALAADEVILLEPFTLEVTEDRVAIAGSAGAQPRRAVRDYGLTRRGAVELISAEQALDYTVTITLPGQTLQANATDDEASPLVWRVPVGEQVAIAAASTRPGPPIARAVTGALGGALLAGAGLWLWSRRRPRSSTAGPRPSI
jgi:hypothetical protein